MLPTLETFPKIPQEGFITIFERESKFQIAKLSSRHAIDPRNFTPPLDNYHLFSQESLRNTSSTRIPLIKTQQSVNNILDKVLIPVETSTTIALWNEWRSTGWYGIYEYFKKKNASDSRITKAIVAMFSLISGSVSKVVDVQRSISYYFYPHLALSTQDLIENFAPIREWKKSWIRALAWHPSFEMLAIALHDDTIRIFVNGTDLVPLLKSSGEQNCISCLAWRPHINNEISAGVEKGLLIWKIDSSMKPSWNKSTLYTSQSPVTCIEYSPDGNYLITSSAIDSTFYLYDLRNTDIIPIHKLGGGIPFVLWSPNLTRVLTTTPNWVFRIWETGDRWEHKRWSAVNGRVEAAAWSPCGQLLFFASESILYLISFYKPDIGFLEEREELTATPVFDLRSTFVGCEGNDLLYKIGGKVLQLLWDETGSRIVCLFEDSELIPVFRVQLGSFSALTPQGVIRGDNGECPLAIAFSKHGFGEGALLTIAWSSGRFQYFPMIFAQMNTERLLSHDIHWNYGFSSGKARDLSNLLGGGGAGAAESSFREDCVDYNPLFSSTRYNESAEDVTQITENNDYDNDKPEENLELNSSNIRLFSTS